MEKPNIFKRLFSNLVTIFHNRSMSTQLILTIVLIFMSFFTLQLFLNSQFFQNYYTQEEFNEIHIELLDYIDKMNQDDADMYDLMYDFTTNNNAVSVVVSRDFRLMSSVYSEYSIIVNDTQSNTNYTVLVPNNYHNYNVGENVYIEAYEYTDEFVTPIKINITGTYFFDNGINCEDLDDCIKISGSIVETNKPVNLNYQFENNILLQQEITKLSSSSVDLLDVQYEYGYWYTSNDNNQSTLVFIHDLGTFDFIVTIIPIEDTTSIISIVNSYNNYVYLTAIAIILIWSFRLTSIISKPVQNIESVASEIANLNFNVKADEYNNRENASLSNSINLIARNLKETLDTLRDKNGELVALYDEQVKQVTLKKQLVSSISHELKTPLMIMQVTIQGILDGIIDAEDQGKELNNVLDEINKSSMMIGDMLQIYRLEDAQTTLELSEFNLSDVVHFFVHDFEKVLSKHNLKLDLNLDRNVFVEADLKLIKRVISNFFTNAIKYTPDNQKIYIEVSENDDKVYFELTNYGTTISETDLEHIWIPFFRGSGSHTIKKLDSKGSGIGLYLVSEILKAHQATFDICNVENGVKAYFYINKKSE